MGLFYIVGQRNVSLTANSSTTQDVLSLQNSANCTLRIHQIRITSQYNVDERIDLMMRLFASTYTIGSGGTALTPAPVNKNNTVASKITRFAYLDTTAAVVNTGSVINYEPDQWSQLAPYEYLWTPETRIEMPVSTLLVVNNANTYVGANRTINFFVKYEEN